MTAAAHVDAATLLGSPVRRLPSTPSRPGDR